MVNVKYTKKQIVEAIRHWSSVLEMMDKSRQVLQSKLNNVYGKELVKDQHVVLSSKQFETLYRILNDVMFDNILDVIPVKCMEIDSIIDEWHKQDEMEKIPYQNYDNKRESYGFYINIGDIDRTAPKDKQILHFTYHSHIIYINLKLVPKSVIYVQCCSAMP